MANWAELPSSILTEILMCLPRAADRVRFGVVCTSWRCIELENRHCSLPLEVLGLMLPGPDSKTRKFYGLSDERTYNSLLLPVPSTLRFVGSSHGWLVTLADNLDMAIFHPVSKVNVSLPPIKKASRTGKRFRMSRSDNLYVQKAVLSLSYPTSNLPRELIVMIIYGKAGELAFARPGDDSWTVIRRMNGVCTFLHLQDILFYRENFYAVDYKGRIIRCIVDACPRLVPLVNTPFPLISGKNYLVESLGDLFLVRRVTTTTEQCDRGLRGMDECYMEFLRRYCSRNHEGRRFNENILPANEGVDAEDWVIDGEGDSHRQDHALPPEDCIPYKTVFFSVHKLDFEGKKWVKMFNLEDRAFFVGWNASFSVSSSSSGCKANCIYFTDDFNETHDYETRRGYDNGVFSLVDKSIEPVLPQNVHTIMPPPQWLSLILT